ncbi:hypothetical protein F5148DRAFT_997306 [Russula earlei]|uniref:Uncharacterized protein n=1 Tax=Russula earlei TaxID=71964 RepID=A0ACC0UBQ4_9AGAM|nr:hypothetical protein F5148DRAFT_997306 [Russula earlei]
MPITYPRSSPGHSSYLARVSDADESIVLSDLVRSGEVSRLRRRGAIAIRDIAIPQSPAPPALPASPPPPITSGVSRYSSASLPLLAQTPPEPDLSETDDDEAEQRQSGVGRWFFRSRLNLRDVSTSDFNDPDPLLFTQDADARPRDEDEDLSYVLFCGGRLRESEWYSPSTSPSTPRPPPDLPAKHRASAFRRTPPARRPSHMRARRTNGCGVLIHLNAEPRRRQGTWVACGAAAETVVRMDARYFDCCAAVKMIKSACGCVREGVGCRVCGNPLGIIYVPCQAAANGLNIPRASSSASSSTDRTQPQPAQTDSPMHPPGPNYWLPSVDACQRRRHAGTAEIYNFFSERVRSAPEYTFPLTPSEAAPSRLMRPLSPGGVSTLSQRLPTSSMPDPFASRQWSDRDRFSMLSVENVQGSDSPLDGQPGEIARIGGDAPHQDENQNETEGDNSEKPEDSGTNVSGLIPWAER